MAFVIMEMTGAIALMFNLATPATAKRHEGGITTNPLLTTAGLDQRRFTIAAKTTMLSGHGFRFHAMVSHGLFSSIGNGRSSRVDTQAKPRLYGVPPVPKDHSDIVSPES